VQLESARICRLFLTTIRITGLLAALVMATTVAKAQQAIEDNIRPVARVCLEGQPCVGSLAGNYAATVVATPAVSAVQIPEAAAAERVLEVAAAESAFDAAAKYQMTCFACHSTGAAGAPVTGDSEAWAERMDKGMEAVMANAINGINAMPAKGMCMDCSDDNLVSLVEYMLDQ
jgi:cytochrome c5